MPVVSLLCQILPGKRSTTRPLPKKKIQRRSGNENEFSLIKKKMIKKIDHFFEHDQKSQNKHSENWVPKKLENHVRGGEV